MKRFIVDAVGNFVFFVPLVALMAGVVIPAITGTAAWDLGVLASYVLSSLVIAPIGGRLFTWFLTKAWYPLCKETF